MANAAATKAGTDPMARWAAFNPERRRINQLKPFERNARTHSPEQVAEVARSMEHFGWTMPVLIDEDDGILAGHARVLAATSLKLAEVPVIVARGWTDEQKREYVIADNKLSLNAGWDWNLLALEVGDLRAVGADLSLMGFSALEVSALLAEGDSRQRQLAATDPAEDATWPTLEIKMPPYLLDKINAALATAGDGADWQKLERLLFGAGDG